jgi:hypothetical protein
MTINLRRCQAGKAGESLPLDRAISRRDNMLRNIISIFRKQNRRVPET